MLVMLGKRVIVAAIVGEPIVSGEMELGLPHDGKELDTLLEEMKSRQGQHGCGLNVSS